MSLSFFRPSPIFLLSAAFLPAPCALRADDAPAAHPSVVANTESDRKAARAALERVRREIGGRAPAELEREICRDAWTVKDYLEYLGFPRIPELEQALFADASVSEEYAYRVLHSPWSEAETAIARDPFAAANYATRMLCRPWPEAEPVIFANGDATSRYHAKFPHRITPEARRRMEADPWGAANCAANEGRRRPDLESVILKNPAAVAFYTRVVVKAPWPESEKILAGNPDEASRSARLRDGEKWTHLRARATSEDSADNYARYDRLREGKYETKRDILPPLARILADDDDPDPRFFNSGLLRDPESRAILSKRPGLLARIFALCASQNARDWRTPEDMHAEIFADAEASVVYAMLERKALPAEVEEIVARHGRAASLYATQILKRRWPEAEPAILRHPRAASDYAVDVLKKPWPEAEPVIALTATGATIYASRIMNSRWPRCESVVAASGDAGNYAQKFIKERWPEGEAAIARSPSAPNYASRVKLDDWPDACRVAIVRGVWSESLFEHLPPRRRPELEKFILDTKSVKGVVLYATHLLKARWPEGEALLLAGGDAKAAGDYVASVMRAPWPEAEALILKNPYAAMKYALETRKTRWPEGEAVLAQAWDYSLVEYCSNVAGCRVPVVEKALIEKGEASVIASYASRVIQGRWPEAEPLIRRDVDAASRYAVGVLKSRWPEMESEILNHLSAGDGYAEALLRERNALWEATLLKSGEPCHALSYAKNIIGGPWPEAEAIIARDVHSAFEYAKFTGRRFPAVETELLKDAGSAMQYAELVLKSRWPEAEPLIIRGGLSVEYAMKVIKGRFPEAEPDIAKDAKASLAYAKTVLRDRFPAGEPAMATDAVIATEYAQRVLHGRFEAAEPTFAANATLAFNYARTVLSGRFLAGEPVIARDANVAFNYVFNVVLGPWPEGEAAIAGNRRCAAYYAVRILKRRWPEAEPVILAEGDDPDGAAAAYARAFPEVAAKVRKRTPWSAYADAREKGIRNPDAEAVILKSPDVAFAYARDIIKGRWPEAESVLLKSPGHVMNYARIVIKGRWPEAEAVLLKNPEDAMTYALEISKCRWPEAEVEFAKSPYRASLYAAQVIKGAWPEAEAVIATNPESALYYARCALKHRWPAGEAAIRRDARMALIYASEVLNARWPEGEEIILKNAEAATWYSILVLGDRWPEFEKRMDGTGWYAPYVIRVIRKRMLEAEATMFRGHYGAGYMAAFIREPDARLEKILMEKNPEKPGSLWCDSSTLLAYIRASGRKSWPEFENHIAMEDLVNSRYFVENAQGPRRPFYEKRLRDAILRNALSVHECSALPSYARGLDADERLPDDLESALYDELISSRPHFWPGLYGAKRAHPLFETKLLRAVANAHALKTPWGVGNEGLLGLGVDYACHIRGSRWPELEKFLFDRPDQALRYRKYHADLRVWPELESALVAAGENQRLKSYRESTDPAKFVARPYFASDDAKLSRDEARVLFDNHSRAFRYARDVIRGRWPEFEKHLMAKTSVGRCYRDEDLWGDTFDQKGHFGYQGEPYPVAGRYIREIVRGPLPEYEAEFAKETKSVLCYSRATRRDFMAGEPNLLASVFRTSHEASPVGRYLWYLLDDPESTLDRTRLFKGPDGARFRCEALVRHPYYPHWTNEPGEKTLRDALESRE